MNLHKMNIKVNRLSNENESISSSENDITFMEYETPKAVPNLYQENLSKFYLENDISDQINQLTFISDAISEGEISPNKDLLSSPINNIPTVIDESSNSDCRKKSQLKLNIKSSDHLAESPNKKAIEDLRKKIFESPKNSLHFGDSPKKRSDQKHKSIDFCHKINVPSPTNKNHPKMNEIQLSFSENTQKSGSPIITVCVLQNDVAPAMTNNYPKTPESKNSFEFLSELNKFKNSSDHHPRNQFIYDKLPQEKHIPGGQPQSIKDFSSYYQNNSIQSPKNRNNINSNGTSKNYYDIDQNMNVQANKQNEIRLPLIVGTPEEASIVSAVDHMEESNAFYKKEKLHSHMGGLSNMFSYQNINEQNQAFSNKSTSFQLINENSNLKEKKSPTQPQNFFKNRIFDNQDPPHSSSYMLYNKNRASHLISGHRKSQTMLNYSMHIRSTQSGKKPIFGEIDKFSEKMQNLNIPNNSMTQAPCVSKRYSFNSAKQINTMLLEFQNKKNNSQSYFQAGENQIQQLMN